MRMTPHSHVVYPSISFTGRVLLGGREQRSVRVPRESGENEFGAGQLLGNASTLTHRPIPAASPLAPDRRTLDRLFRGRKKNDRSLPERRGDVRVSRCSCL